MGNPRESTKHTAVELFTLIKHTYKWPSLLDTLFIDNNSPTQTSIKIKFTPLGNPLILHKCISKLLHLVNRSNEAVKITHTFAVGKWFDYSYFECTQESIYGVVNLHGCPPVIIIFTN